MGWWLEEGGGVEITDTESRVCLDTRVTVTYGQIYCPGERDGEKQKATMAATNFPAS